MKNRDGAQMDVLSENDGSRPLINDDLGAAVHLYLDTLPRGRASRESKRSWEEYESRSSCCLSPSRFPWTIGG